MEDRVWDSVSCRYDARCLVSGQRSASLVSEVPRPICSETGTRVFNILSLILTSLAKEITNNSSVAIQEDGRRWDGKVGSLQLVS